MDVKKCIDGAVAVGIARVASVRPDAMEQYREWVASGKRGPLAFLEKYPDIRSNPALLLEGARSIIVAAFPYLHPTPAGIASRIAKYARGLDYHDVVRNRLESAAVRIRESLGGETRVCVDTAPLRERYWAVEAGVGFVGWNNSLIVPGHGSFVVLGEIITTLELKPDTPCRLGCGDCGACLRACPTGALSGTGAVDASRCLSCLTIEHRGEFPPGTDLHGRVAGCDTCQDVCPHNRHVAMEGLAEFAPNSPLLSLSPEEILRLTDTQIRKLLKGSSLSRIKPADLRRNLGALLQRGREETEERGITDEGD